MEVGDIVNMKAGSVDLEVLGVDDKYVKARILFFPDCEMTAAYNKNILVKDNRKSFLNQARRQAEEAKHKKENERKNY